MALTHLPGDEAMTGLIRQAWPPRAPGAELRATTLAGALGQMRHARNRKARAHARRLAAALYVSVLALVLLVAVALAGITRSLPSPNMRWLLLALLATVGTAGAIFATFFASRWCRAMGLPRELQWAPLAGMGGTLLIVAGILGTSPASFANAHSGATSDPITPAQLQTSLDIVSRALTRTMTVSESQEWLAARLPREVERAWFVTPAGLVALSSITTANEISHSVLDFITLGHSLPTTLTAAIASDRAGNAIVPLHSLSSVTQAIVYSSTPYVLMSMVRQALQDLSTAQAGAQVATRIITAPDGTLAGIAALTPHQGQAFFMAYSLPVLAAGAVLICLSWAAWVFMVERARGRNNPRARIQPLGWAGLTALLLPVGLLMYLFARNEP
jgi:hypothetical protein